MFLNLNKLLSTMLVCVCCYERLFSMEAEASRILSELRSVKQNEVGFRLGQLIEEENNTLCKLDAQAEALSKHLRLELHFGNSPDIFRTIDGITERASGIAKKNPSLFNTVSAVVDADTADTITFQLFNLLFRSKCVSFLVPTATHGGNAIFLKVNLSGHKIDLLKPDAGLFSPNQDKVVDRVPTNIFGVCIRVQKEFVGADGVKIRAGTIKHPSPQIIVISLYPENPNLDLDLPPISE